MSNTRTATTQNSPNVSMNLYGLDNSAKKVFLQSPFENDDEVFGKKVALNTHYFNNLSPDHEKISLNSPKSKNILNKTAGKDLWDQVSE